MRALCCQRFCLLLALSAAMSVHAQSANSLPQPQSNYEYPAFPSVGAYLPTPEFGPSIWPEFSPPSDSMTVMSHYETIAPRQPAALRQSIVPLQPIGELVAPRNPPATSDT